MERKKAPNPNVGKIQWKKIGGGFLRLPNRIIKPGDVFWAAPSEIPKAFRDSVIPLDQNELIKVEVKPAELLEPEVKVVYEKRLRADGEKYNIYDSNGKKVNEKALSEEEADMYLKSLQG